MFAVLLLATSCEDVIEVEVPTEEPRLVVEGLLRVDTEDPYIPVAIQLTQTAGFFDEILPVTDVEEIVIIYQELVDGVPSGSTETSSLTQLDPGSGIYVPDPSFDADQRIPTSILEDDYQFTLVISWRERRYAAQTRYVRTVPIDSLIQGDRTLFGEDETEVIVAYTDEPGVDNYYVFDFGFADYLPSEDTFYKDQAFAFSYFYDRTFAPGTELPISILGADQEFYNYMDLLVEQSSDQNNPFQTPVATVRGNVFDVTELDNLENFDNASEPGIFPLGYFAVVQQYTSILTIQ